ncbi:DNA cytosine methyltransferase [Amycolatopsis sp. OK19-0408]|uniref:DNA (cytosine-5-)-methyltransferase n=1 Tax=Amycolatopsis iheyensis TaxID=2945988 RepID=A0A9X2NIH5_9PSEU|nr:DNA cytosine methyltransferase [Amycolatopsis iheyensis]MCR6488397.1 DNA cytosine methyltransferase [Amycolatopsis iheyensis]
MQSGSQSGEQHPLRCSERPDFELGDPAVRLVDLFSGCGGLTLGVAQAARSLDMALDVALSVDIEMPMVEIFQRNFPKARAKTSDIAELIDGEVSTPLTKSEKSLKKGVGPIDILVGGPPCQGHSDLNNHTRRNDPKNELYLRMVRAAEVFKPKVLMIENVPAVLHDKTNVVQRAVNALKILGYKVADAVIKLDQLDVAQRRRRHILVAAKGKMPSPSLILGEIATRQGARKSLSWAIGDLASIKDQVGWDKPSRVSPENLERMEWLIQKNEYDLPNFMRPKCHQQEHSYKSMYGRLKWSEPAQTITSGFGSIGQGRYMHPDLPRALTPHEAARIQGFPDYFSFDEISRRTVLSTTIGNAVPPPLARAVLTPFLRQLKASRSS